MLPQGLLQAGWQPKVSPVRKLLPARYLDEFRDNSETGPRQGDVRPVK